MNKIEKVFRSIDRKVDKKIASLQNLFKGYFPFISTIILGLFFVLFVFRIFYTRPQTVAAVIEDDIKLIVLALEKIDARCNILSIDDDYNEVDFLTVKSFTGSQVGPFNLAYPENWEGPYLSVNPTIQGNNYEIVKAKDGIFILPGNGVKLPNGFVVGKDIKVTKKTAVSRFLKEGGKLTYKDKIFAAKLVFKVGDWDTWHLKKDKVEKINRLLKEFNEAMPFTKNEGFIQKEAVEIYTT